ncbi:MAG: hypothetical protein DRH17_00640 [Deltaproteobacteria bacterium]|nr:MAG: hypothetical protein DRH17_00640 [Deltaproteobacteria bacterium]
MPAGGEGAITVELQTAGRAGVVTKYAVVHTNDPRQPKIQLTITGSVIPYVTVKPRRVRIVGVEGQIVSRNVEIIPHKDYPFKILKIESNIDQAVRYCLSDTADKHGYVLTVENIEGMVGHRAGRIIIETDSEFKPRLTVYVDVNMHRKSMGEKR